MWPENILLGAMGNKHPSHTHHHLNYPREKRRGREERVGLKHYPPSQELAWVCPQHRMLTAGLPLDRFRLDFISFTNRLRGAKQTSQSAIAAKLQKTGCEMWVQVQKAVLFSECDTAPPQRREISEERKRRVDWMPSFMFKKEKCHLQKQSSMNHSLELNISQYTVEGDSIHLLAITRK